MLQYQINLWIGLCLNYIIMIFLFYIFIKRYPKNIYLSLFLFSLYVYYITKHILSRIYEFNDDIDHKKLKKKLIKDIYEQDNNLTIIAATIFSFSMLIKEKKTDNDIFKSKPTNFLILAMIFGIVIPALITHDNNLESNSIESLVIYDIIEFTCETLSVLLLIKGLLLSYLDIH